MTVELRPYGTRCNIQCRYCYQEPRREAGNQARAFDMERMKAAIIAEGGPFSLFGGEPLMLPIERLEELWAWGLERYGSNSVQTNGTLIRDAHVALFRKYKVSVGMSIDGPGELNDLRWGGSHSVTRSLTAKSDGALRGLLREAIPVSLIVTLHRGNAVAPRLDVLLEWIRELDGTGLKSMRLHLMESETEMVRRNWALTDDENISALLKFLTLERELTTLTLDLFDDMRGMLIGDDRRATCIWKGCDPYTTRAVRGVEGNGQRSNCGRTNKEGIEFVKSEREGFERSLGLYTTPQEAGGCQGCRFFLMCKGNCPGTAIDGDWRNRTEHCAVWKAIFAVLERELMDAGKRPLSQSEIRGEVEGQMIREWQRGRNPSIADILDRPLVPIEGFDWRREIELIGTELADALAACQTSNCDGTRRLSNA